MIDDPRNRPSIDDFDCDFCNRNQAHARCDTIGCDRFFCVDCAPGGDEDSTLCEFCADDQRETPEVVIPAAIKAA